MKQVFHMPKPMKIIGRTSSITNSFVNGIIPVIKPTDEEVSKALETLGMTEDTICCAYCGDACTEWDHFHPLIKNKMPTGYISEIHNLVPACGKCNQSKGNKEWREWMLSDAAQSPKSRNIADLTDRIQRLEEYERKYVPLKIDFGEIVGEEIWARHWDNCRRLHEMMYDSQKHSDYIKNLILKHIEKQ